MSAMQENNTAEEIRKLKDVSKFYGACFQNASLHNRVASGELYLKEIHTVEMKIKMLEGKL